MRTTSAHSPQVHRSPVRRTPIARTTAPTRRSTSRATAGASSSGCARYRSTEIRDAVYGQLARGRDARIRTTSGSARQGSTIAIAGGRGTSAATRGDESVACRLAPVVDEKSAAAHSVYAMVLQALILDYGNVLSQPQDERWFEAMAAE